MPTYETPSSISALVELALASVRITAGEPGATSVDVRPSDAANSEDVSAAEATRVECTKDALLVRAPRLRSWLSRTGGGSIHVDVALPAGSSVEHGTGAVVAETKIGEVEVGVRDGVAAWVDLNASAGRVENALEASEAPAPSAETVEIRARTSVGAVVVRRAS
jgi:hypothetical protein